MWRGPQYTAVHYCPLRERWGIVHHCPLDLLLLLSRKQKQTKVYRHHPRGGCCPKMRIHAFCSRHAPAVIYRAANHSFRAAHPPLVACAPCPWLPNPQATASPGRTWAYKEDKKEAHKRFEREEAQHERYGPPHDSASSAVRNGPVAIMFCCCTSFCSLVGGLVLILPRCVHYSRRDRESQHDAIRSKYGKHQRCLPVVGCPFAHVRHAQSPAVRLDCRMPAPDRMPLLTSQRQPLSPPSAAQASSRVSPHTKIDEVGSCRSPPPGHGPC